MEDNNTVSVDVVTASADTTAEVEYPVKSWRLLEIEQQVQYGFDMSAAKSILDGWASVDRAYYVLHDKDKDKDGNPVEPHVHLLIKFNYPVPTANIFARIGSCNIPGLTLEFQQLNKIKGGWSSAVNYLTHRDEVKDYPWKHVYEFSDIVCVGGDVEADSEQAHAKKILKSDDVRFVEILEGIEAGEIKEYNLFDKISMVEYINHKDKLDKAFKYYIAKKIKGGMRNMQVVFITGKPGVGKDTFAREWCKERGLDYYCTNNNPEHPFDNYRGEPVIIWSDARDDIYKPHNLHQLLDNHYMSLEKARYTDKYVNCDYLLVTSIKPITEWYTQFYQKEKEDKSQLYRRVGLVVEITEDFYQFKVYNQAKNSYDLVPGKYPNIYGHKEAYLDTAEKQMDYVKSFLGNMAQTVQFVADNVDNSDYKV